MTTATCAEIGAAVPRSTLATGSPCLTSMESSGGGTHSFCAAATANEAPTATSASPAHPSTNWERARRVRRGGWPRGSRTGSLLVTPVPAKFVAADAMPADLICWFICRDHAAIHAS